MVGMEAFKDLASKVTTPRIVVTVTQLDTGALETQINTEFLSTKIQYIIANYDDDMRLIRNPKIQIQAFIIL
ncbi:hypothetical protein D3C71_234270 [compost metagenome]